MLLKSSPTQRNIFVLKKLNNYQNIYNEKLSVYLSSEQKKTFPIRMDVYMTNRLKDRQTARSNTQSRKVREYNRYWRTINGHISRLAAILNPEPSKMFSFYNTMKYVNTINENKCSSLLLYQGLGRESVKPFFKEIFFSFKLWI